MNKENIKNLLIDFYQVNNYELNNDEISYVNEVINNCKNILLNNNIIYNTMDFILALKIKNNLELYKDYETLYNLNGKYQRLKDDYNKTFKSLHLIYLIQYHGNNLDFYRNIIKKYEINYEKILNWQDNKYLINNKINNIRLTTLFFKNKKIKGLIYEKQVLDNKIINTTINQNLIEDFINIFINEIDNSIVKNIYLQNFERIKNKYRYDKFKKSINNIENYDYSTLVKLLVSSIHLYDFNDLNIAYQKISNKLDIIKDKKNIIINQINTFKNSHKDIQYIDMDKLVFKYLNKEVRDDVYEKGLFLIKTCFNLTIDDKRDILKDNTVRVMMGIDKVLKKK